MARNDDFPLALPKGTILAGQYIVNDVLGQGGFGITYKVQDYKTSKFFAIKEYFPDVFAFRKSNIAAPYPGERAENFEYGKARFLDEAKTLAQFIGNKGVVRIYSYFEENNTAYFVMDFVEGQSFDHYIKEHGGKISVNDAQKILVPVMDALTAVHSHGIIHRDVTPDNIYIKNDGSVILLDFGAARYSLGDKSRSLDVILKRGFAPKEQYSMKSKQGPFTDVYSLGATFYFAITGKRPPDSVDRVDEDELIPPRDLGVPISKSKEKAILTALSVQAAERYKTTAEFKAALLKDEQNTSNTYQPKKSPVQQTSKTAPKQKSQPNIISSVNINSEGPDTETLPPATEPPISLKPRTYSAPVEAKPAVPPTEKKPKKHKKKKKSTKRIIIPIAGSCLAVILISTILIIAAASKSTTVKKQENTDSQSTSSEERQDTSHQYYPKFVISSLDKKNTSSVKPLTKDSSSNDTSSNEEKTTDEKETPKLVDEGSCGKDGDNVKWALYDDNTLYIYGQGEMENYTDSHPKFTEYDDVITNVIIEDGVTCIGNYVFYYCQSLTSIDIPGSVTSIGECFNIGCDSLTDIRVDGNNKKYSSIDGILFDKEKTVLIQYPQGKPDTKYRIPSGVKSIGDYAFFNCTNLSLITPPDSVTSIGNCAFYNCTSLSAMVLRNNLTSIGNGAFYQCTRLTAISIPDSVKSIGNNAFNGCTSLNLITIPNNVTSIGKNTFSNCTSLSSIDIPENVKSIGDGAFMYSDALTDIKLPKSLTIIGKSAFYGCDNIKDVYYSGTEEQWKKIDIRDYNTKLIYAEIHYNSDMP